MIFTHTVNVQRDGFVGNVQTAVPVNKSHDQLTDTPAGPVLRCVFLSPPPPAGQPVPWQPGDYVILSTGAAQSAYKVLSVEDRTGSLIPAIRMLAQGQVIVP